MREGKRPNLKTYLFDDDGDNGVVVVWLLPRPHKRRIDWQTFNRLAKAFCGVISSF